MKTLIRRVLPRPVVVRGKQTYAAVAARRARRAFEATSSGGPEWLSPEDLPRLQERYPYAMDYDYDPASLDRRALERAAQIARVVPVPVRGLRTLELGAQDGAVSRELKAQGATHATALDLATDGVDERALQAGVEFVAGDAGRLPFDDAAFDLVVSYNAFEHFSDPERVLREATRVVKQGGFIYVNFGPLYMSPFGLHAARAVNVPYCQFLWPRDVLEQYVADQDLYPIPFETLNEWPLTAYREMWKRQDGALATELYREIPDLHGNELIREHPTCFASKTDEYDNLLIGEIEALFRRTA